MKKASKGMEYTRRGSGVCSLRSADGCKDTDVIVAEQILFKGRVIEIDNYAFRNNAQIKSVVIPEGIVSIGDYAFKKCKNLEYVVFPQSLKSIGRGAFMHCEKLNRIVLPSTIVEIATETFACCYSLESIDLSHIRAIGKSAFAQCDSLVDIAMGDCLAEINTTSFRDSGYFKHHANWKDGLLYLGKWVIGCNGSTGEYLIRSGTVGIASDVFANEWNIKRTKNPEYDDVLDWFNAALECPNMMLPDLSHTPEYFEEIIPAKIRYEGTSEEWNRIVKLRGEKRIPAFVTTDDGTIETYL
jgi:hypothetical protein